jgi:hypothetical protein
MQDMAKQKLEQSPSVSIFFRKILFGLNSVCAQFYLAGEYVYGLESVWSVDQINKIDVRRFDDLGVHHTILTELKAEGECKENSHYDTRPIRLGLGQCARPGTNSFMQRDYRRPYHRSC